MPNHFILFYFLCLINTYQLCANQKQIAQVIEGIVIDSLSEKSIPYVQIFNECTRENAITDINGYFKTTGSENDTFVFIALGYLGKVWIPSAANADELSKIRMTRRIYDIEPVIINNLPDNYKDFRKSFLELKPDQGLIIDGLPPKAIPKMVPDLLDTNIIATTGFFLTHPISYLWYNYSKEEKSKRKVLYLEQEQREMVAINQKFNRDLIHRITGLENDELTAFLDFCNFSHQYLYNATDYEIVEAIHNRYEEYQKIQIKVP